MKLKRNLSRLDLVMLALSNARDTAMRNCVEARIPECGDFASIAQDLDWVLQEMNKAREQTVLAMAGV